MVIRICPYCDQKMTKKHHCDSCNSFVWKANKMDVNLNPQSFGEENSVFDNNFRDTANRYDELNDADVKREKYGANYQSDDATSLDGEAAPSWEQPQGTANAAWESPVSPEMKGKVPYTQQPVFEAKKNRSWVGKVVICVAAGVVAIGGMAAIIFSVDRGNDFYASEDEPAEEYVEDEWGEPADIELSEQDLASYTENCTEKWHLNVDGEALVQFTEAFLEGRGYVLNDLEIDFSGYKSATDPGRVYYARQYYAALDETYSETISIDYDAVTNDVHDIYMRIGSMEDAVAYVDVFVKELLGVPSVTSEEIEALFTDEDEKTAYCKNCEIRAYRSDSGQYIISFNATGYPYAYDAQISQKEVSQEEVRSGGEECNETLHMDISGKDQVAVIDSWLEKEGFENFEYGETSENFETLYNQLGGLEYCRKHYEYCYMWGNMETEKYIMIVADTYSDRIHEINTYGFENEDLEKILVLLTDIAGGGSSSDFIERCIREYEQDGYSFAEFEQMEFYVYGSDEDSTCSVSMYPFY